jgi:hypothetical protein
MIEAAHPVHLLPLCVICLLFLRTIPCSMLQRYAPPSSSSSSSGSLGPAAALAPARHCWRVLQLLQPEPGPLGSHCMAFAG